MRTIFRNTKVFTAATPQSYPDTANCLVVNNGLIEYVGLEDDTFVKTAEAQGCDVRDVQGKTIAPGFIDG